MADKPQASGQDKSKMIKIGAVVVVVAIIAWQVMGLFGGGGGGDVSSEPFGDKSQAQKPKPNPDIPKKAKMISKQDKQPTVMTERERQLMQMQQQTEAKYIAALNELQMLRVEKEIAETNKDISAAKLDTISAQKGIVALLQPPAPKIDTSAQAYAQNLETPIKSATGSGATASTETQADTTPTVSYTVVSVSKLRGKWMAVMGGGGKLYHVAIGDILGKAGTVVIAIDKSGVLLETNGKKQKISMVPII